ncbi:MAG: caspase family protein [Treponema sp.]|nr:caspase family protein [Treponema sp.]
MFDIKKISLIALLALAAAPMFAESENAGVERYGLYIGSNDGGKSHQRLLYAGSDAIAFQKIMTDIGGISKSNGILLLDPTKEDVDTAFQIISGMMEKKRADAKRSEFVFYYSGHSDENALLLGRTSYDYSSLKAAITNVPSDVHVVILDSCFSGNFIRTKGGSKQKPFLIDDSTVVKGHAYLSSSSSQESSQESDEIGSSFFTNAMINGLRGAADTSGDKKVTLNELYSYAFNETLLKTEKTADPQHPNYNITLVGSGDLVLSDVSASDCVLTLSRELTGRVIVRDKSGKLVSEVNKTAQTPIYLALEEGQYGVTVIGELSTLQGNFVLGPQKNYALTASSLSPIARAENRARGDEAEEPQAQDPAKAAAQNSMREIERTPFVFSFVCNEFNGMGDKDIYTNISLALLRSSVYETNGAMISFVGNETEILRGAQFSAIYNIAQQNVYGGQVANIFNYANNVVGLQIANIANISNELTGVQLSNIVNVTTGNAKGVQAANITNIATDSFKGIQAANIANVAASDFTGLQAAVIANVATGNVKGAQVGFINICKGDCDFQLGLINYSRNGIFEIGASYTSNKRTRISLNSGSKYLYTVLGAYVDPENFSIDGTDIKTGTAFFGLGARLDVWKVNFDFEVIANEVLFVNTKKDVDDKKRVETEWYPTTRFSVGFKPVKHLRLFAGAALSYQISSNKKAFSTMTKNIVWDAGRLTVYPEFDFGLRFTAH